MPGLHARVMPTVGMDDDDISKWLDLVASAAEPNPYFSPEYLTTPVDHTGVPVVDSVLVATDADDTWIGLLALWDGPRDDAWPTHHLSTGWFHVSTPLLRRGAEDDALAAMLETLLGRGARSPVLDFPFLPATSTTVRLLTRVAHRGGLEMRTRLALVGPWAAPKGDGSIDVPKTSQRERRIIRHLAKHLGVTDLALRDVSDDPDAVDQYLALEAEGWKSDGAHGGYGLTPRPEWFRTLYTGLRARDAMRMLVLDGPAGTAYMALLLLEQGVAYGFLDTYPDSLRDFSPGKIGRQLTLQYCRDDDDICAFDPCLDLARYPVAGQLYPDRRQWSGVTLARRGWPSLLLRHLTSARVQGVIGLARPPRLFVRTVIRTSGDYVASHLRRR